MATQAKKKDAGVLEVQQKGNTLQNNVQGEGEGFVQVVSKKETKSQKKAEREMLNKERDMGPSTKSFP